MSRIKSLLWLALLGGLTVVLPITILFLLARWFYGFFSELVAPLTALLVAQTQWPAALADGVVFILMLALFCLIGLLVMTSVGAWLHAQVERVLKRVAPGYKTISDVVAQFFGGGASSSLLSGQVALARLYGEQSPVTVTVIVTARHTNGDYTVFMPTAPIPTSGVVYHLPASCITLLPEVSVEAAMKTIIACGAGTPELLDRAC